MKKTLIIAVATLGSLSFATAGERTIGDGNIPDFLAEFDINEDGVIDEEERQLMKEARKQKREERRAQWDTNGDGEIDEEEREAAREAQRARREERRLEKFNAADTDGDGVLSFDEFTAIKAVARLAERHPEKVQAIYNRLDKDESGDISPDEFLSHLGHRRGGHRPPHGGGGDAGGDRGGDAGGDGGGE